MKCPNCGREMNNDAVFCISCGQRISGNLVQPSAKKDRTPLIIGLGVLAIVLIIGVACVLLLDPFGGGNTADPYAYLSTEAESTIPQSTGAPEVPDETQPDTAAPELPEDARPIEIPAGDHVGLPIPDAQPEVLQAAADQYWEFLSSSENAQEYGLIDFVGDKLPELIVQEHQEDGSSAFSIYYISGEDVRQITTDPIAAAADARVLSVDGTLMVVYSKGYINYVIVDKNLNASVKFVKTEQVPDYRNSTMRVPADDRGLLDLYFLGSHEKFSGEGWIRMDGTDYYYKYGKPCTHHWIEEDGFLYYLGDRGCVTEVASQTMLSNVLNEYFASYQTAFNEKDTSYLKYATDKNRKEEAKWFQLEENKYLTISDLTCDVALHKGNDSDGSIEADVNLEYMQIGEWEQAKETSVKKNYRITLVWNEDQWYVDHIGNR